MSATLLQTGYFFLAGILILIGLAGAVVPILPGVPLVFGGMLLAAWADHFRHIGTITLILLGILAFGEPADFRRLACIALILAGIVGLKLASPH